MGGREEIIKTVPVPDPISKTHQSCLHPAITRSEVMAKGLAIHNQPVWSKSEFGIALTHLKGSGTAAKSQTPAF